MKNNIDIFGAKVHNLKNVDVSLPHNSLTVITGLSGSGKSSLAFDTIFAEGQRRYLETFSTYARNFLGGMERPDVDKITGLGPVISIEQKTTNKNPRSTVGTTTEIYDYTRLLFSRASEAYSYLSGEKMVKYTEEQILELIINEYAGKRIYMLAPLVKARKGHYKELFEQMMHKGYLNVRIDGEMCEMFRGMKLERYKNHDIEVVVDKMVVDAEDIKRIKQSLSTTLSLGDGLVMIMELPSGEIRHYSKRLMCPVTGISYKEPDPHNFSFNSPQGACPKCKGLGVVSIVDVDKVIPNRKLSVYDGALVPLGKYRRTSVFQQIEAVLARYDATLKTPIEELPEEAIDEILYGSPMPLHISESSELFYGTISTYDGLVKYIQQQKETGVSAKELRWAEQFSAMQSCPECGGARLCKEALHFRINGKNIYELASMDITLLYEWFDTLEDKLSEKQRLIASEIVKEIMSRLRFLLDVGLGYLSLSRSSASLSGGEGQRIRLATQVGSQLVNVFYILDEPSIGLHSRDNDRLINSLKSLRDSGNTVIVVEHDRDIMLAADYIVDLGPKAGRKGGNVVFAGTPAEMLKNNTLTANYLKNINVIPVPSSRREGNGKYIKIFGANGNNLKNVDVEFPLGKLICVTGVSGGGKSSLINDTLQPILSKHFYRSLREPLPYNRVEGIENIDKVVDVDQSPLGRTPRSNPATYTGVFS
ncbi:MAG: excinuclease ABC subunit UvrA, partial [Bacteroidaceae bacterium]|nr:excinuclease ABC subunit UvrA [Bacteroidaceae bacterium]